MEYTSSGCNWTGELREKEVKKIKRERNNKKKPTGLMLQYYSISCYM